MDERGVRVGGPRGRSAWRLAVGVVFWAMAALMGLTLAARGASGWGWGIDLVATFAGPAAVAAVVLGVVAVVLGARWAGLALAMISAIHVVWLGDGRAARSGGSVEGPVVRVMTFNYLGMNSSTASFLAYLAASDLDVVVVLESPATLIAALRESEAVRARFPYRSLPTDAFRTNKIKLSRWPLEAVDIWDKSDPAERFEYVVRGSDLVSHPETPFVVSALLPHSPRTPADWREGNDKIRVSGGYLRDRVLPLGYPVVVCADLNATPSGHRSWLVSSVTGLRRTKPLWVLRGTWPADLSPLLRVAIDDVLVSSGVRVVGWRTVEGESFGSDHVPVVVELELPRLSGATGGGGSGG